MQKEATQKIFYVLLITGLLLVAGGVYLVNQQVRMVSESVKQLEDRLPTTAGVQPSIPKTERQLLSLYDADREVMQFVGMDASNNWNARYDSSKVQAEPLTLDNGRKVHVPYDESWGNSQFYLDTFDYLNNEYHFGPMHVSEMHGAFRDGAIRVRDARSLDAALADPSYTSQDCALKRTFKPAKAKVGNVDAVRFDGEACEATWVGYEIQFGDKNLILVTGPQGGEEILKFVLERM